MSEKQFEGKSAIVTGALATEPSDADDLSLAAAERAHVLRVLALCDHNKARAARALDVTRATLYAKLRAYGVEVGA